MSSESQERKVSSAFDCCCDLDIKECIFVVVVVL